jgi:outer membrane receptor protein involved in Fe transport
VDLNYTPTPGRFFCAFAVRGYKSGGIDGPGDNFKPEHVTDYELGWKGQIADGHIQTQLGGFYNDYQGMQESVTRAAPDRHPRQPHVVRNPGRLPQPTIY